MDQKRTIAEIDADIAQIKNELADVRGTETEVYSRIVGYYRSVRNWNKGKREEYNHRKQFVYESGCAPCASEGPSFVVRTPEDIPAVKSEKSAPVSGRLTYEFFGKSTCPNCPPVKKYLEALSLEGNYINVDTEEGLNKAAELGVMAAPTVILFDENGEEAGRAYSVSELSAILSPAAEHVA